MNCSHCGVAIPDNSDFCTLCGIATSQKVATPSASTEHELQFGKLLQDTLAFCLRHPIIVFLVGLIAVGIPTIFDVCAAMVDDPILYHVFYVLMILAACYAGIVAIRQCLYTVRGNLGIQKDLMFPPFFMFLRNLGFVIIVLCVWLAMVFLTYLMLAIADTVIGAIGAGEAVIVWAIFIANGVFALWLLVRYYLVWWFIVDQDMGIIDSLGASWQVSSDNFWALLGVVTVFLLPLVVCVIVCLHFFELDVEGSVQAVLIYNAVSLPFIALSCLGCSLAYMQLIGQPNCLRA